jgi:hypothetical protein
MTLIRLTSDNCDELLVTINAYEEIVLTMSTGDYCTHTAIPVVMPEDDLRAQEAIRISNEILEEVV